MPQLWDVYLHTTCHTTLTNSSLCPFSDLIFTGLTFLDSDCDCETSKLICLFLVLLSAFFENENVTYFPELFRALSVGGAAVALPVQ